MLNSIPEKLSDLLLTPLCSKAFSDVVGKSCRPTQGYLGTGKTSPEQAANTSWDFLDPKRKNRKSWCRPWDFHEPSASVEAAEAASSAFACLVACPNLTVLDPCNGLDVPHIDPHTRILANTKATEPSTS